MRRRDFNVLLRNFNEILKAKIEAALESELVRINHLNERILIRSLFSIAQVLLSVF